jgi:tetratricopeptide (TPR) repeat protein
MSLGALTAAALALYCAVAPAEGQTQASVLLPEAAAAASAGRSVDALAIYALVIEASPQDRDAYVGRAHLFEALGLPQLAAPDLTKATKIGASDASLLTSLCRDLALANHDLDGAVAACNTAVKLAPEDAATLGARGYANLRRGAYAAAQKDFEAALNMSSAEPDFTFGRGVALVHQGQTRDGRDEISIATLDRATLVSDWEVRGYGIHGEMLPGRHATTASQPVLTINDRIAVLNSDEVLVKLADGCARIMRVQSTGQGEAVLKTAAASTWSGQCRFGLIHGEGKLAPPGASATSVEAVYGRSSLEGDREFADRAAHVKQAYASMEAALLR